MDKLPEIAQRVTVRIDGNLRAALTKLRQDHYERTGEVVEDSRLIRMVLRRAVGADTEKAAVSEAMLLAYQLNQIVAYKLIQALENNADALIEEARQHTFEQRRRRTEEPEEELEPEEPAPKPQPLPEMEAEPVPYEVPATPDAPVSGRRGRKW